MKHLNTVISDDAGQKLEAIMNEKRFKNRADTVDWIINEVFKLLKLGGE